jgi:hypothetical protein
MMRGIVARRNAQRLIFGLLLLALLAGPALTKRARAQAASDQESKTVPATQGSAKTASGTSQTASAAITSLLIGKVWTLTKSPSEPPPGSIYVFFANGTLLEDSCVETYRIATWTQDPRAPHTLHVTEDHHPAFTATILQLTPNLLLLRQRFVRSHESREITLTSVPGEASCPELPK